MKFVLGLTTLFALSTIAMGQSVTQPTTTPADPFTQLAERMPTTLVDPSIKSFDVVAMLQVGKTPGAIRVRKTESGKVTLYAEIGTRHVPIFFAVDREAFQYDPAFGTLRRMHNVSSRVELKDANNNFSINAAIKHSEKPTTQPTNTLDADLDLRSLMLGSNRDVSVRSVNGLDVITGRSAKGNPADFWIDAGREFPLVALVFNTKEGPFFTLSRIEINRAIDESNMIMPPDDAFKKTLTVSEVDNGFFNVAKWEAGLLLSCLYEAALDYPEFRAQVEKKLGKIDWDAKLKYDNEAIDTIHKAIGEQLPEARR